MSLLTRDEAVEEVINCPTTTCDICKLNYPVDDRTCAEKISDVVRSLRDDYNAEVEKNKRLTAELKQVTAERETIEKCFDTWYDNALIEFEKVTAERDELKSSAWQECDGDAVCAICSVDRLSSACKSCFMGSNYKWRGLTEQTEQEAKDDGRVD